MSVLFVGIRLLQFYLQFRIFEEFLTMKSATQNVESKTE